MESENDVPGMVGAAVIHQEDLIGKIVFPYNPFDPGTQLGQ
jgi:hypothetical protein